MASKKYTSLLDLPDTPVDRCSQVLANKMQCWKAGDVVVEEELSPPPTDPAAPKTRTYQFCQMHATMNQRAEEAEAKTPTKPGEKSALDKMLGVDLRYRTTVPPRAKEEHVPEHAKTQAEKDWDKMMAPSEPVKDKEEKQPAKAQAPETAKK